MKSEMKLFRAFKAGFDKAKEKAEQRGERIGIEVGEARYNSVKQTFEIIGKNNEVEVSIDGLEMMDEIREVNRRVSIYTAYLQLCSTLVRIAQKEEGIDPDDSYRHPGLNNLMN